MRSGIAAVLLLLAASAADAQVSAGGSWLFTPRDDLAEGPGAWVRLAWPLTSIVRLEAEAGREWGRDTDRSGTCLMYWPEAIDCVDEQVDWRNTVSRVGGHILVVSPRFYGFRAGFGSGLEAYRFEVDRRGRTTDRRQAPASSDVDGGAPSFLLLLEFTPPMLRGLTLDARGQQFRIDFGHCMMDTWDVCGSEDFRRVALGGSFRF